MAVAKNDVSKAEHQLDEAKANLQSAQYELDTKQNLYKIDPSALPAREIGRLQVIVGLDGVTPGSSCIANAYSNHHEEIVAPETKTLRRLALHVVDGVALVHALLLRIQTLLLPFKTLIFGGH